MCPARQLPAHSLGSSRFLILFAQPFTLGNSWIWVGKNKGSHKEEWSDVSTQGNGRLFLAGLLPKLHYGEVMFIRGTILGIVLPGPTETTGTT